MSKRGMMDKEIETLVTKFGEDNRRLIESAIKFLREQEPSWNLNIPIDYEEFVKGLISHKR
jgi:hypothetical protein